MSDIEIEEKLIGDINDNGLGKVFLMKTERVIDDHFASLTVYGTISDYEHAGHISIIYTNMEQSFVDDYCYLITNYE